ncbi:4Fe-4S dicluster domain-containing protein [Desulfonatronum thioautotrophicum]|uniref:4Fe-4S dicluster domain-containing protein n=1 Tax=Desulfonatronum thioautotrophicum TaxID=617001 RepID=UPI0005EAE8C1|nr:4Fe-4S dicluster domain-containing protein [Desulfonatronum thioautotrophicum]
MAKTIFIDTSRCTACRGCQVACKEWKGHRAVPTKQRGTHQNPPDFTPFNYKLVRFSEHKIDDRIHWLFFPDQCRHCVYPPCKMVGDMFDDTAILHDEASGAVLFTDKTKGLDFQTIRESCPYDVPRLDEETGLITKCDMCIDRIQAGMQPACVKVCPTGSMSFGEREAMLSLADTRLERVKREHPEAQLLDRADLRVIYLVTLPRSRYHQYAGRETKPLTRKAFLAKMTAPARRMTTQASA